MVSDHQAVPISMRFFPVQPISWNEGQHHPPRNNSLSFQKNWECFLIHQNENSKCFLSYFLYKSETSIFIFLHFLGVQLSLWFIILSESSAISWLVLKYFQLFASHGRTFWWVRNRNRMELQRGWKMVKFGNKPKDSHDATNLIPADQRLQWL